MATLGRAVIEFAADTAAFTGDVGRAQAVFEKSMSRMQAGLAQLGIAAGVAAGVGALGALVKGAIDSGDELNKLSQKVGISVERLSELKLGAELSDVSMEALAKGMKGFNKALVEAQDGTSKSGQIFKALGIDINQGPDVALQQMAQRFKELPDGAEKSTLAVGLFGKAGMDMIPWLNQGSEGMKKSAEQARALGLVMSEQTAKAAEQLNDNMKLLGKRSEAVGIQLAAFVTGPLVSLTDNLVEATVRGRKFWQMMVEGAKFTAATLGSIAPGKGMDRMAESLFEWDERQRAMRSGPNLWPGQKGAPGAKGDVNKGALTKALAGINDKAGKAVKPELVGPSKEWFTSEQKLRKEALDEYLKELGLQETAQADWNKTLGESLKAEDEWIKKKRDASEAIRAALDPMQSITEAMSKLHLAVQSDLSVEDADAYFERITVGYAMANAEANTYGQTVNKNADFAKEFGLTMTSAFEDAIVRGKNFRDILKGIDQDIARIIIRKSITEPAGNAISSAISSSGIGDFFKNLFKAEGGPVSSGQPYIVGERGPEMFVPSMNGSIIPNGGGGGGGGGTYYIDARGADESGMARLEAMIRQVHGSIKPMALAAVRSAANRRFGQAPW